MYTTLQIIRASMLLFMLGLWNVSLAQTPTSSLGASSPMQIPDSQIRSELNQSDITKAKQLLASWKTRNSRITTSSSSCSADVEVVICFDTSGSMGGLLNDTKTSVRGAIETLLGRGASVRLGFLAFGDSVLVYNGGTLYSDSQIETALDDFIASVVIGTPDGGGDEPENSYRAMGEGTDFFTASSANKLMIMVTDASPITDARAGTWTQETLSTQLQANNVNLHMLYRHSDPVQVAAYEPLLTGLSNSASYDVVTPVNDFLDAAVSSVEVVSPNFLLSFRERCYVNEDEDKEVEVIDISFGTDPDEIRFFENVTSGETATDSISYLPLQEGINLIRFTTLTPCGEASLEQEVLALDKPPITPIDTTILCPNESANVNVRPPLTSNNINYTLTRGIATQLDNGLYQVHAIHGSQVLEFEARNSLDTNGICLSTTAYHIEVKPAVSASINSTSTCTPKEYIFTTTVSGDLTNPTWNFGDSLSGLNNTADGLEASHIFTSYDKTYHVNFSASTNDGCPVVANTTVFPQRLSSITLSVAQDTICAGESIAIAVSGKDESDDLQLYINNEIHYEGANTEHDIVLNESTIIHAVVETSAGCILNDSIQVVVQQEQYETSIELLHCDSLLVGYTATSELSNAAFTWSFNDSTFSTQREGFAFLPLLAGSNDIDMTYNDGVCAHDTTLRLIRPFVIVDDEVTKICQTGGDVTFSFTEINTTVDSIFLELPLFNLKGRLTEDKKAIFTLPAGLSSGEMLVTVYHGACQTQASFLLNVVSAHDPSITIDACGLSHQFSLHDSLTDFSWHFPTTSKFIYETDFEQNLAEGNHQIIITGTRDGVCPIEKDTFITAMPYRTKIDKQITCDSTTVQLLYFADADSFYISTPEGTFWNSPVITYPAQSVAHLVQSEVYYTSSIGNTCIQSLSQLVEPKKYPNASMQLDSNPICIGDTLLVFNTSYLDDGLIHEKYLQLYKDGELLLEETDTLSWAVLEEGTYLLNASITSSDGCTSDSSTLFTISKPTSIFGLDFQREGCISSIFFPPSSSSLYKSLIINSHDTLLISNENIFNFALDSGLNHIQIAVSDGVCSTALLDTTFTVKGALDMSLTGSLCSGVQTWNVTKDDEIAYFEISLGGITYDTVEFTTELTSGDYTVNYLMIDSLGCSQSKTDTITIFQTPNASFHFERVCGGRILLHPSSNYHTDRWYQDGIRITNWTDSLAITGTTTFSRFVETVEGCTDSITTSIDAITPFDASFDLTRNAGCDGIQATPSYSTAPLTTIWYTNGDMVSDVPVPSIFSVESGAFNIIELYAVGFETDSLLCSSTHKTQTYIPFKPDVEVSDSSTCRDVPIDLNYTTSLISGVVIDTTIWDIEIDTETIGTIVQVTSDSGCVSIDTGFIHLKAVPEISVSLSPDNACENSGILEGTYGVVSNAPYTILFDGDTLTESTILFPSHITHQLIGIATLADCRNYDTTYYTPIAKPIAEASIDINYCEDSLIVLIDSIGTIVFDGNINHNTASLTLPIPLVSSLTEIDWMYIKSSPLCKDTVSETLPLYPKAAITSLNWTEILGANGRHEGRASLFIEGSHITEATIHIDDTIYTFTSFPIALDRTFSWSGLHTGTLTYEEEYTGCLYELPLEIFLPAFEPCYQAPTFFTPNTDSHNDEFWIETCRPLAETSRLVITNSIGHIIYETEGSSLLWDGRNADGSTFKGSFIWKAQLNFLSDHQIITTGIISSK